MPRYQEFMSDLETIGRGIIVGSGGQEQQFAANFREFLEDWTKREGLYQVLQSTQRYAVCEPRYRELPASVSTGQP